MKIKALRRFFITLKKVLKSAKEARKEVISDGIKLLQKYANLSDSKYLVIKNKAKKIYHTKAEEEAYLDEIYNYTMEFMQKELDQHIYFISKELDSTGNFKLEEGSKSDRWFQSCINLVKSRFYPEDLSDFDIENLNVYRVLRIHNRFLRNRFEERIELYLDQSNPQYKKSFEYLFYGVDPSCPEQFWNILEQGYFNPEECESRGMCPYVPLVNSVVAADKARIHKFLSKKRKERENINFGEVLKNFNFKINQGVLLVCKVIIVRPQQDPRFPNFDLDTSFTEAYKNCPLDSTLLNGDIVATSREAKNDSKHKVWFIHDHTLVLPEYLIYFDYEPKQQVEALQKLDSFYMGERLLTSLDPELKFAKPYKDKESIDSIEHALKVSVKEIKKRHKHNFNDKENESIELFDYDEIHRSGINFMKLYILNFMLLCAAEDPEIKEFKSKLNIFEEIEKKSQFTEEEYRTIDSLSMSGYGYGQLPEMNKFKNLIHLDVSFNKVKDLNFLKGVVTLESINLAGNLLESITDFSHMMKLELFDCSFNKFNDINSLQLLSRNPKLRFLNIRGNPFCKRFPKLNEVILRLIPQITSLDDINLSTLKTQIASKVKRILNVDLISEYSTNKHFKPENLQTLKLINVGITSIQKLGPMENVEKLIISRNQLQKLDNLDSFPNLKELNAESNFINNISGIEKAPKLVKLELGSNRIKNINGVFEKSKKLQHLSLESNMIESIQGLKVLEKLLELYIGENHIADLKQIRFLSNLKKLIVIDMWGNPLCKEFDYRLYVVYQVKDVKVLDGTSISQAEYEESKESFTGRLSEELLQMKLKGQNLKTIESMDLSRCKLRDFDAIFTSDKFPSVQEINVTGNHFTCFKGFKNLPNLKILIIADNRLSSFEPIVDPKYKVGLNGIPVSKNDLIMIEYGNVRHK